MTQIHEKITHIIDDRLNVVVGILAYYARGRGFDSRTVLHSIQKNMYVFTKKNVYKYVLIRYLESTTQALSAYFGLDSRECNCL
jgi:hypothetical protein